MAAIAAGLPNFAVMTLEPMEQPCQPGVPINVVRVQPPGEGEGEGLTVPVLLEDGEAKAPTLGEGVALGAEEPVQARPLISPLALSVTNITPEAFIAANAGPLKRAVALLPSTCPVAPPARRSVLPLLYTKRTL